MGAHRARPTRATFWRRRAVVLVVLGALAVTTVVLVAGGGDPAKVGAAASHAPTSGATGATVAPTSTAPPGATFTLAAVGDTMLGKEGSVPSSPETYLDAVKDDLTADAQIVFGNLEGTLTEASGSKCEGSTSGNCFAFKVPPSFASALQAAGFTVLNDANNHFHDFGAVGAKDTVDAIHAAGMVQTGLPEQVTVVQAGQVRVGFVAFGPYDGMASLLDIPAARALVRKARSMADVVVVYMHAGAEGTSAQHVTGQEEVYVGEDRGNPQAFAHMAIDEGAALVLASGPHVLRGMEFYKGHLVAYSLGNFAGFGNFTRGGVLDDSGILRVTLDGTGAFRSARLVACQLTGKGQPVPGGGTVALVSKLSRDDFAGAAPTFAPDGTITPPG